MIYCEQDGVRFRGFNIFDKNDNIIGKVTAATVPLNEDKTKFKCQFSFLSPKDLKNKLYKRKTGKLYSLLGLNSDDAIDFDREPTERLFTILRDLILEEANRRNIFWLKNKAVDDIR